MKNQIYRVIAVCGVFLGLMVASVHAQTPSKVEVNIPFEFFAGKATLKPGIYTVKRMAGNYVMLRGRGASVMLNAPITLSSNDPSAVERLVFKRYGSEYFLTQLWLTVDSGRQLLPTKAETRAAQELGRNKHPGPQRVEIAIKTR